MVQFDGLAGAPADTAGPQYDNLLLVATGADGSGPEAVWTRRRTSTGWSGWSTIGQPTGGARPCRPAVARDASGNHVIAVPGQDGALWYAQEDGSPGTGWSAWQTLGLPGGESVVTGHVGARAADQSPLLIPGAGGLLQLFVVASDLTVWQVGQGQAGGPWLSWQPLGLPGARLTNDEGGTLGPLAGAVNTDGTLELFTTGIGGTVERCRQQQPDGSWYGWESLGSPGGNLPGSRLAVSRISDGRLELFVAGSDGGDLWHTWQDKGGGGWSDWASLGQPSGPGGDGIWDLAVAQDHTGGLVLFATDLVTAGPPRLWMRNQWAAGTPWVKWTPLPLTGGSTTRPVEGPALTAYGDQLMLSLRETGTGNIYVVTQKTNDPTTPAGWSHEYLKF